MRLRAACMATAALWCVLMAAVVARADSPQQEKEFEREVTIKVKIKYLLYLPPGYESDKKDWPLLMFLHGAGESGDNLAKVKLHGPPKLIENKKRDFPCIVVSPQSDGWAGTSTCSRPSWTTLPRSTGWTRIGST